MKKQTLKRILFFNVVSALIIVGTSTMNTIKAEDNSSKTSLNVKKSKVSSQSLGKTGKINLDISNHLSKNQEAIFDKFNSETKVSSKKLFKSKTYWSAFIKKINYLKNDQLEIYVTSEFKTLSEKDRQEIITRARITSLTCVGKVKGLTQNDYLEGLSSLIFCEGDYLGKTEYLNNSEITWNKFCDVQKN